MIARYMPIAALLALMLVRCAQGAWPARVLAPYVYLGAPDHFQLTQCDDATGQKFFALAFVIADSKGNPAWDGRIPVSGHFYLDQITAIRKRGGDVLISFGGADGTELAVAEPNANALQQKYQQVIDAYHATWLDFDIEGDTLRKTEVNRHRNAVLAALVRANPGLRISFTLPVDPQGLSDDSRGLLLSAKSQGLPITSVNLMTMDFGEYYSRGKPLSAVCIASAIEAHDQVRAIDPALWIGLTPLIGRGDVKTEIFTPTDAAALLKWAQQQDWIHSLSFWALNRDNDENPKASDNVQSGIPQKPWEFTRIFQAFTK